MTIEEKSRIKAHLDELCEWVDEQVYSQDEQEAAADTIEALEAALDEATDRVISLESEVEELTEERDEAADRVEALEAKVRELKEERDDLLKLSFMADDKVAILIDYLQTLQYYHRSAAQYYMEEGKPTEEDKHGEAFVELVSAEVMTHRLFVEGDEEYVKAKTDMYAKLADSYANHFGLK